MRHPWLLTAIALILGACATMGGHDTPQLTIAGAKRLIASYKPYQRAGHTEPGDVAFVRATDRMLGRITVCRKRVAPR
jgi:hypothetical protein